MSTEYSPVADSDAWFTEVLEMWEPSRNAV